MKRTQCVLRIGSGQVRGAWFAGFAKGATAKAIARVESEGGGFAAAISAVLSQILPRARLASPYVRVGISGSHVRAAIALFAKLPKAVNSRGLLISQRFCREFRLEPASFVVHGSPLGPAESGGEAVLCQAIPKALLAEIEAALAAHGLHADVIAPDFMLRFSDTSAAGAEAPGIVLMKDLDGGTVLVWDAQGRIVHVAPFAVAPGDGEAQRRIAARVFRYARIVGGERGPVAVYAGDKDLEAMLRASMQFDGGWKLLPWRSGQAGGLW
jgi:hypothetical protein